MKVLGNFLFGIFGIGSIAISLYKLVIDSNSNDNWGVGKSLYGILFGFLLVWISLNSNKKTSVEKFIEKEKDETEIPFWWQRILGFIIDHTIILLIYSISIVILDIRLDILYSPVMVFFPFFVLYYCLQEYLYGTTIGKRIFKLKVISAKAEAKISFSQALIRAFIVLIPINILFFFSKKPIGLHDILSKTIVVK